MSVTTATATGRPARYELVHRDRLANVTSRPPLLSYIAQVWERRHFILADARGRVTSGTRGTLLGPIWLVLKPILDGGAYFLIFGVVLGVNAGIDNFLGYLIIGVFLFSYTSRCLTRGATSLISGKNLIRAFSFPRASLPVASVVNEAIAFAPVLAVMLLLIVTMPPHEPITWRWLLLPVILVLQTMFNLGLALTAARATARIPDLSLLIGFATRLWLYASGVMFSFDRFVTHPDVIRIIELNPLFIVLDMARDVLLYSTIPSAASWALLAGWGSLALTFGTIFFWRGEESYGRA
ncbi:ABC transporter permease [Pengzhenrongella sicca]|uniref:ABC transporter permease n=1 Tax=Pengzhenrongella sicca TaxID=2819238 RepID=UPI001D0CCFC9|nr:ABC transporter permease [Pengzhenrongella sicca]